MYFSISVFKFQGITLSELLKIPRLPLPLLSDNATALFHTSSTELKEVSNLQANVAPKQVLHEESLNGTDAINLGFRPNDVFNAV